jgi:hypothetical protein
MDGAVESGRRAAREVGAALDGGPERRFLLDGLER